MCSRSVVSLSAGMRMGMGMGDFMLVFMFMFILRRSWRVRTTK